MAASSPSATPATSARRRAGACSPTGSSSIPRRRGYSVVTADGNATRFGPSTPTANIQPTTRRATGRPRRHDAPPGAPRRPRTRPPTTTTTTRPPSTTTTTEARRAPPRPRGSRDHAPRPRLPGPRPPPGAIPRRSRPPVCCRGPTSSSANPSGMAAFASKTETSPVVATEYLPGQRRLGGHGWIRREPELDDLGVEGDRLHALPGRAHHSDELERNAGRDTGPGVQRGRSTSTT